MKLTVLILLTLLHKFIIAEHCEYIFYIASKSRICLDEKCETTYFSEIVFATGKSACFINIAGNQTSYMITNIFNNKPIYYSCDRELVTSCH